MGRAQIIENRQEGWYYVKDILKRGRIDQLLKQLRKEDPHPELGSRVNDLLDKLDKDPQNTNLQKEVNKLQNEQIQSAQDIDIKDSQADILEGTIAAERESYVPCIDYTDDLAGIVATAEIVGERGIRKQVIIHEKNGAFQPGASGKPCNNYVNWCIYPGWQKWKYKYRFGYLTDIDYDRDLGTVTVDNIRSKYGQEINPHDSYSNIPIVYMDCNAAAFEIGDHVCIQIYPTPRVIGFADGPKQCPTKFYLRPTIKGKVLKHGGQVFLIKYKNNVGNWQTTGGTIRGKVDGESTHYWYCGPFDLSNWDRQSEVYIGLNRLWRPQDTSDWPDLGDRQKKLLTETELLFDYYIDIETVEPADKTWDYDFVFRPAGDRRYIFYPSIRTKFKAIGGGYGSCVAYPGTIIHQPQCHPDNISHWGNYVKFFQHSLEMVDEDEIFDDEYRIRYLDFDQEDLPDKSFDMGYNKKIRNSKYYRVDTIYKKFSAQTFREMLRHKEDIIYNPIDDKIEANRSVIVHDFDIDLRIYRYESPRPTPAYLFQRGFEDAYNYFGYPHSGSTDIFSYQNPIPNNEIFIPQKMDKGYSIYNPTIYGNKIGYPANTVALYGINYIGYDSIAAVTDGVVELSLLRFFYKMVDGVPTYFLDNSIAHDGRTVPGLKNFEEYNVRDIYSGSLSEIYSYVTVAESFGRFQIFGDYANRLGSLYHSQTFFFEIDDYNNPSPRDIDKNEIYITRGFSFGYPDIPGFPIVRDNNFAGFENDGRSIKKSDTLGLTDDILNIDFEQRNLPDWMY